MGKTYPVLDQRLRDFIARQHMFFVATAPLSAVGRINLSPKGLDSFAILDDSTVAYLDLTGSGIETVAHLRENTRIVIMLCAFDGPPLILRLHGRGHVLESAHPEFASLLSRFPPHDGVRSIIRVALERISDSCGYGVPLYDFKSERTQLPAWVARKGPQGIAAYQREYGACSIDGLPGLPSVAPSPPSALPRA